MTQQPSIFQAAFADKQKSTRREKCLARREGIIPWSRLLAVLEPFYPKGQRGRPPIGLERMLRVYFRQQWDGLADEALEDARSDSQALQGFARMDLAAAGVPEATTRLKFRRRLEAHDLCQGLFAASNADLATRRPLGGRHADRRPLSSTKNQEKQRDPAMHQARTGHPWYFGMKAHLGAARDSELGHTVVVTAANVVDITKTAELLHGQMARQRGQIQTMAESAEKETLKAMEKAKVAVRVVVAHPFHILKNLFRHRKVRYRGLAKNGHQRYTLFGLANGMIGARPATA